MFSQGELVVYKRDVCEIKEITINKINGKEYYTMVPIDDNSLTIYVPTEDKSNLIRNIISKDEANKLINKIPMIETLDISSKSLDNEYKNLFESNLLEDLVTIIKTAYLRNDARISSNKKPVQKDNDSFKKAERLLYNELSISLGKSFDETKEYIIKKFEGKV